jgi:predicted transcriptional regulator
MGELNNIEDKGIVIPEDVRITKPSRKPKKYKRIEDKTIGEIIRLTIHDWTIWQISQVLNVSESSVSKYQSKYRGAIEREKMNLLDKIEGKMFEKAMDGDAQLIKFIMQNKKRSTYGNRVEVTKGKEPNKIVIKGYDGHVIETIDKPDDNSDNNV